MQVNRGVTVEEIAVPASVANLGAGLDTLAVAVRLYLRVRAVEISARHRNRLEFDFVGQRLDGENFIERAFRFLAQQDGRGFPSMRLEVHSDIPMRAGLGSSSAAIVAGLRLYERIAGPRSEQELLVAACRLEGHPDNVAAALLGGLTSSCQMADGSVAALSSPWPESLALVVATPQARLLTEDSRRVLPERIARADAVFNLQRAALLLQSLRRREYRYLREALADRWHQPYREALVPGLKEALALRHPDLLGVCLSGSGPSVVALAEKNLPAIERLLADLYHSLAIPCRVCTLRAHHNVPAAPQEEAG